jgi:hypothetical protein
MQNKNNITNQDHRSLHERSETLFHLINVYIIWNMSRYQNPNKQEFGKTRLHTIVKNHDYNTFALKKRTPFFACFASFCV